MSASLDTKWAHLQAPDYDKMERKRINKDPQLSLRVFNQMKAEVADLLPDYVPTRKELADRLVGIAFGAPAPAL